MSTPSSASPSPSPSALPPVHRLHHGGKMPEKLGSLWQFGKDFAGNRSAKHMQRFG